MSAEVMEFTDADFAQQVEGAEGLTVVDFWAPWCGPCRFVAPVIEELAVEYAGRIRVGKLNVDDSPATAARYGIRSIPTIGIFVDGEPQEGIVGAVALPVLRDVVERQLTESRTSRGAK